MTTRVPSAAQRSELITPGALITLAGHTGIVERITATHLVLRLDTGDEAIVPLSAVDNSPVIIHPPTASDPN